MDKGLVRRGQSALVSSKSISGAAGKGMVAAGAGGLTLGLVAGLIPFVTLPMLCVLLIVAGIFLWE